MQNQANAPSAKGAGIWGKLFQIQTSIKNFCLSEDSDKQDARTGKAAYRYTPGWQITETVRQQMDKLKLMLVPDYSLERSDLIEYPVYKTIGGNPLSFQKKEIHIVLTAGYTWIDAETGESAGPFHVVASGANGTDKSTASALALAERYFFLKFFHIATRDADEEPDAHDSDYVPGIPKTQQAASTAAEACRAHPVSPVQAAYGYGPVPQPAAPREAPAAQPFAPAPAPAQPVQQGGQNVTVYAMPPTYNVPQAPRGSGGAGIDLSNAAVQQAIARLANFDRTTNSFRTELNQAIGMLGANGIYTDQAFVENLCEAAQARREGRQPNFK